MQAFFGIDSNFVVETVWFPVTLKQRDADGLPKVVKLESTAADSIHDTRIVDNGNFDAKLHSSKIHICVRCRTIKSKKKKKSEK